MTNVEFRPTLKSLGVANDKVKLVLEIPKDKIAKELGSLAMLEGGKITASFRPGQIDPREVLECLEEGRSLADIGADYDMHEEDVEEELSRAREYYAPYAAAWDEKRKREDAK